MGNQIPVTGFLGATSPPTDPAGLLGTPVGPGGSGRWRDVAASHAADGLVAWRGPAVDSAFTAALGRAMSARRTSAMDASARAASRAAADADRALLERARDVARQLSHLVDAVRRADAAADQHPPRATAAAPATDPSRVVHRPMPATRGAAAEDHPAPSDALDALDLRGTKLGATLAAIGQALNDASDSESEDALSGIVDDVAQVLASDPEMLAAAEALVAAAQAFGLLAPEPASVAPNGIAATLPSSGAGVGDVPAAQGAVLATPAAPAAPDAGSGLEAAAPGTIAGVAGTGAGEPGAGTGTEAVRVLAEALAATGSEPDAQGAATPEASKGAPAAPAAAHTAGSTSAAAGQQAQTSAAASGANTGPTAPVGGENAAGGDSAAGTTAVAAAGTRSGGSNGGSTTPNADGDGGTDLAGTTVARGAIDSTAPAAPTITGQPGPGQRVAVAGTSDTTSREPAGRATAFDAASVKDQVASVVIRQARLVSAGNAHEMTLRLEPGTLGAVHVRLSLLEGGLSVALSAANADTHRALAAALPQLRATLLDAGLRLERLDVGVGDNGERNGRGFGGNAFANSNGSGSDTPDGSAGRRYGGEGQQGEAFTSFLFDNDGRPFEVAPRGLRSGEPVPQTARGTPTTVTAEALRPAPGMVALSRGGYGAYGALRRLIGNALHR